MSIAVASHTPAARATICRRSVILGLLGLLLCFGFLGTRSIWDPDEGRYTNVALTMLESGNWVDPMRNEHTGHWTKPPLTYWLLAASMGAFGSNPWAARLPVALACLANILLVRLIARRLGVGDGTLAGLVYATMLLPSVAGQLVTTDFVLAAFQTLAMYGYVCHRFDSGVPAWRGVLLMWSGFALAFLTKGPPALLPLLAVLVMAWLAPRPLRAGWRWQLVGIALFVLLTFPWFVWVSLRHSGLLGYFLGTELVDRVASDSFGRNGEWYGWLKVYLPTLLLGTLPWTRHAITWVRGWPARLVQTRRDTLLRTPATDAALLLVLWVLLPLLAFCLARSRLPLYILPLWAPLAIAIAATRKSLGLQWPRLHWITLWVAVLLSLRWGVAYLPTHKDAALWADAIRERAHGSVREVIFINDMARYGLHVHLGAEVEKVSTFPVTGAPFNPEFDESLRDELRETDFEEGLIYITKVEQWPDLRQRIEHWGYKPQALGTPYSGRVIFEVNTGAP